MPPPVPPIAAAPLRAAAKDVGPAEPMRAPWDDPAAAQPSPTDQPAAVAATDGRAINAARLIERIPSRMAINRPMTVEIRIPRGAVLATSAAASGRNEILSRALSVRLRAPSGGCQVENAAPETQWFDARASHHDDEVRWRWVVTPRMTGSQPLLLSVSLRAIAADGMAIETNLPEQQALIRVSRNYLGMVGRWMKLAVAVLLGAAAAFLATGGWAMVLARFA